MTQPLQINSWEGVRTELLRRINARVWAPGDTIPPEEQLAEEFQCSRATVNRAMRELSVTGLIERRRKAGTRVAVTPMRKATLNIPVTRIEVERTGKSYRFSDLAFEQKAASGLIASRLNIAPGAPVYHVRTLHFADHTPFLYEERWLNPAALPKNFRTALDKLSVNEWLVRNISYSEGNITFSAANASAVEAEHLGIDVGTALFIVERTTSNDGGMITTVRLAYQPGYRLHTSL